MDKINRKFLTIIFQFLAISIVVGGFFSILSLGLYLNNYINIFVKNANLDKQQFLDDLYFGYKNPFKENYLSILILGLDQRDYNNSSFLTDTILLVTIDAKTGNYLLFSIPRDLWLEDYKTKINALYYYGEKENPTGGHQLIKNTIEKILQTKIDYVMILKMEQIKELIDLIGGVEVEVERSFVDEEFPKDDGSNEVITVRFEQGKQIFDGERALQFIRSRKSKDEIEGTDEARQKRQKKVILAIKQKLTKDKNWLTSPQKAGSLYKFFLQEINIQPNLNSRIIASFWKIGKSIFLSGVQKEREIPWQGEEAILIPKRDPLYQTWILEPKDNNWNFIKDYYHQNLP